MARALDLKKLGVERFWFYIVRTQRFDQAPSGVFLRLYIYKVVFLN